jgi:hypothetical protein
MKTYLILSFLFAGLTLAGCAHLQKGYQDPPAAVPAVAADPTKPNSPANTSEAIARNDIITQVATRRLGAAEIQSDLDGGVTIVRMNENVTPAPTGPVNDGVLAAAVKDKFKADPELGSAAIEVKASHGEIALNGTADSAAKIGRAISLALDVPGVTKVSSDLKTKRPVAGE